MYLRGIIRDGYEVPKGMKIADIDPRKEQKKNCDTVSDKARCIAGSVVEVLLAEWSAAVMQTFFLLECTYRLMPDRIAGRLPWLAVEAKQV